MAKMKKGAIWVLLIVVALIFFMQPQETKKEASADISTAIVTRSLPTTLIKAGTTFTANYAASNYGSGSWTVFIEDALTGGCTPSSYYAAFPGPAQTSTSSTFTAPSSAGSCTFSGNYLYAGSTDKALAGTSTINICQDACTSGQTGCADTSTKWSCSTSNVCGVKVNTACQSYESCNAGSCNPQCDTLLQSLSVTILSWLANPTSSTKTTAINAALLWASNC